MASRIDREIDELMVAVRHGPIRDDQAELTVGGEVHHRPILERPPEGAYRVAQDGLLDDVQGKLELRTQPRTLCFVVGRSPTGDQTSRSRGRTGWSRSSSGQSRVRR